jgi:simple sugar transport system substrate-binding protein
MKLNVTRLAALSAATLALSLMSGAANAAEPTAKWCAGVKIAAFPGGPQGGVFANNVYNGFRQAEADLGAEVTYYFSDWDPNKMLQQIQQAVATKVDGIATYGFAGEPATGPIVDQAFAQGTIFTSLNTSLPDSQKKYAANGFGYVGAPNYSAGFALASEAAKRANLQAGDSVFVWGLKGQGGDRGQRTVGVIEAFEKVGAKVIYQEIDAATNADPNAGTATFVGVMGANPGVKIVVTDHGGLAEAGTGLFCRLRHVAQHRAGGEGRLPEPGDRPAALPAGLYPDPQHLPDQEVRLLRPRYQHRRSLRRHDQRGRRGATGRRRNPLT